MCILWGWGIFYIDYIFLRLFLFYIFKFLSVVSHFVIVVDSHLAVEQDE